MSGALFRLLRPEPVSLACRTPALNDKTTARDAKPAFDRSTIFAVTEFNESSEGLCVMPLRQYFVWVGSILLVALFALDQWLPSLPAAPHHAALPNERVNLRIRSDHKWPERVVFDTRQWGTSVVAADEPERDAASGAALTHADQRNPLDAFAAMQVTPTATNDNASAIWAKPRPLGQRMTSIVKPD